MCLIPINRALIDLSNESNKEMIKTLIYDLTTSNEFIQPNLHFDIVYNQKLFIKINEFNENGTLKDLIYKTVKIIFLIQ